MGCLLKESDFFSLFLDLFTNAKVPIMSRKILINLKKQKPFWHQNLLGCHQKKRSHFGKDLFGYIFCNAINCFSDVCMRVCVCVCAGTHVLTSLGVDRTLVVEVLLVLWPLSPLPRCHTAGYSHLSSLQLPPLEPSWDTGKGQKRKTLLKLLTCNWTSLINKIDECVYGCFSSSNPLLIWCCTHEGFGNEKFRTWW